MHRLLMGLLIVLSSSSVFAQTFPPSSPWIAVTQAGVFSNDPIGDAPTLEEELIGSITDAAAFVASDADFLYIRVRTNADPDANSLSVGALVDLDFNDDDFDLLIVSDDTEVRVYANSVQTTVGSATDPTEALLTTNASATHRSVSLASTMTGADTDFFIDIAVPWTALAMPGLLPDAWFRIGPGTSLLPDFLTSDRLGTDIAMSMGDGVNCGTNGCRSERRVTILEPVDLASVTDPIARGFAESGSVVTIEIRDAGDQLLATTDVVPDANDVWTYTLDLAGLGAGNFSLTAAMVGEYGSQSTARHEFEIGSVATVSIVEPAVGATVGDPTPTISGFSAGIAADVSIEIDGTTISTTPSASNEWSVEFPNPLVDGSYTVIARAADGMGNLAADVRVFEVDSTVDFVSIDSPEDQQLINDNQPQICGERNAGQDVIVTVQPGAIVLNATADIDGTWCALLPAPLAEGTYSVSAVAGLDSASSSFTVDTTGPVVELLSPDAGACVPGDRVTVTGTSSEPGTATIQIEQAIGTVPVVDGMWTYESETLSDESHELDVVVTDPAGNATAVPTREFFIDSIVPSVRLLLPADGASFTRSAVLTVSGETEANVSYEIRFANRVVGMGTSEDDGSFEATLVEPPVGVHNLTVVATDGCGNVGTSSVKEISVLGSIGDPDGDGLNNGEEETAGTDPNNPDTDGDRLSDGDEVKIFGTNPNEADSDGDGVDDADEVQGDPATDALNEDTDGDGLKDGRERGFGTDPTDSDSDDDGVTDFEEISTGSDPLNRFDPLVVNDSSLSGGTCATVDQRQTSGGAMIFVVMFALLRRRQKR